MVIFKSDKVLLKEWNSDDREYVYTPLDPIEDSLVFYLSHSAEIAEGVTFGELLWHFINDSMHETLSLMLLSDAGNHQNVLERFGGVLTMAAADPDTEIDYLEVYFNSIDFSGINDIISRWSFHGYGPWHEPYEGAWEEKDYNHPREGGIAVEFTPICFLQDLPIRINNEVDVYDDKMNKIKTLEAHATVFDLIRAIVFEMTFDGIVKPGDRTRLDDVKDTIEQIEAGEIDLIPWEDIKDDLFDEDDDEEEEEEAGPSENRCDLNDLF